MTPLPGGLRLGAARPIHRPGRESRGRSCAKLGTMTIKIARKIGDRIFTRVENCVELRRRYEILRSEREAYSSRAIDRGPRTAELYESPRCGGGSA